MRREVQEALVEQLLQYADNNETCMTTSERLNPVAEYVDPARLEQEHRDLFLRYPMLVGHGSQVPETGDALVDELSGTRITVRRERDGGLHGEIEVNGKQTEVAVEQRHGLVWAQLGPDRPVDVAAYLGKDLDDELSGYEMDNFVLERSGVFGCNSNWKLAIDGFLETYHVRFLHAQTLLPYLRSNVHAYDPFGPHSRLTALRKRFDKVRDRPWEELDLLRALGIAYQIFPNSEIIWQGTHMEIWTMFPDGNDPNRCISRASMLAHVDRLDEKELYDRSWETLVNTIPPEDYVMGESAQRGFAANAQSHVVFGRNEAAVQHFHEQLDEVLGPFDPIKQKESSR